jgi:hypothetical protein
MQKAGRLIFPAPFIDVLAALFLMNRQKQVVHYTSDRRPASFTVFCENFMNLPPTNGPLGRFRNVDGADLKDGNVLIIKHPLRDVHHIENMTHANLACAGKLLEWCVKRGDLWQLLTTICLPGHYVRSSISEVLPGLRSLPALANQHCSMYWNHSESAGWLNLISRYI